MAYPYLCVLLYDSVRNQQDKHQQKVRIKEYGIFPVVVTDFPSIFNNPENCQIRNADAIKQNTNY